MKHGSPLKVLFDLHLTERAGSVTVESEHGRMRIHVRHRQVLSVEDVPGLLEGLTHRVPEGITLDGGLAMALPLAINAGIPVDDVLAEACRGLGNALATLAGEEATAWVEPLVEGSDVGLTLPLPLMDIVVRGLRTLRSPELVALELAADLDKPLVVDTVDESMLEDLDGSALECVRRCRAFQRLRDAVDSLQHARRGQVREFWWSLDLLLHLDVIEIRGSRVSESSGASRRSSWAGEPAAPPPKPPSFLADFDEPSVSEGGAPPPPPAFLLELEREYQSVAIQLDGQWSGTQSVPEELGSSDSGSPVERIASGWAEPSEAMAPGLVGGSEHEYGSFHFGAEVVEALTRDVPLSLKDFGTDEPDDAAVPELEPEPSSASRSGAARIGLAGSSHQEEELLLPSSGAGAEDYFERARSVGSQSREPESEDAHDASQDSALPPEEWVDPEPAAQPSPIVMRIGPNFGEPEPEEEPVPEAEPEPVPEADPDPEPEPEPEPDPEPEPEPEPAGLPPASPRGPAAPSEPEHRGLWSKLKRMLASDALPSTAQPVVEDPDPSATQLYTDIAAHHLTPLTEELVQAMSAEEAPTELAEPSGRSHASGLHVGLRAESAAQPVDEPSQVTASSDAPNSAETSVREAARNAFVAHVRVRAFLSPAWRSIRPGRLTESQLRDFMERLTSANPLENLGYGPQESTAYLSLEDLVSRVDRMVPHCNPHAYEEGRARQAAQELGGLVRGIQTVLADPRQVALHLRALRELATPPRGSKQARGMASEHFTEAQAQAAIGDWPEALECIRRAGFLDPGNPQIPPFEVACLVALDHLPLSDALVNLDSFECPDDRSEARAHLVAGHLLYRAGQLVEADNRLTRAQSLDPTMDVTHAWLSQPPGLETTALAEVLLSQFSPLE